MDWITQAEEMETQEQNLANAIQASITIFVLYAHKYKSGALTNICISVNIHKYCTAEYIISAM